MAVNFPSAATVQFVTKLLATGRIGVADVGDTMNQIDEVLRALSGDAEPTRAAKREAAAPKAKPAKRKAATPSPVAAASAPARAPIVLEAAAPVAAEPAIEKEVVVTVIPARRGRGRPRRIDSPAPVAAKAERRIADPIEEEAVIEEAVMAEALPPTPRLLRRNDVPHHEHHEDAMPAAAWFAQETEKHSGIVKWFDQRTGKGVLRVSGMSEDIAIDARLLASTGLKRLYKDQEIEAIIRRDGGKAKLVSLGLPGREGATPQLLGDSVTTIRRQARPVVVEIRRDTGKQRKDRAQAERIFGDKPQPFGK